MAENLILSVTGSEKEKIYPHIKSEDSGSLKFPSLMNG